MTRARNLSRLGNENVLTADNSNNLGIGSLTPDRKFDVGSGDLIVGAAITMGSNSGIVSATAFHGDGANLKNLPGQIDLWNKTAAGINTSVSVGIGTTRPDSISRVNNTKILNVGIVTAYKVYGDVTGDVTGNVTSTGFSTFSNVQAVGIVTASSFKVGVGGTDIFSFIEGKASTGKAIAMSMVFG